MSTYFTTSDAVGRNEFLQYYSEALVISRLIMAPFGCHLDTWLLAEKTSSILDDYNNIYRSYEEVISKKIFNSYSLTDDIITATTHKYLVLENDEKMMEYFKETNVFVENLLNPPEFVQLYASSSSNDKEIAVDGPVIAAKLIGNVIKTLKLLNQKKAGDSGYNSHLPIDEFTLDKFGFNIPIDILNPMDIISLSVHKDRIKLDDTNILKSILER